jgi:hypothetical protein
MWQLRPLVLRRVNNATKSKKKERKTSQLEENGKKEYAHACICKPAHKRGKSSYHRAHHDSGKNNCTESTAPARGN